MKKIVLTYGLIAGVIVAGLFALNFALTKHTDMEMSMIVGYASMIIAMSMIFFGVRQYRDKHLAGKITFKTALWLGLLIALVASVIYVIYWMIYYSMPGVAENFQQQYIDHMKAAWIESGLPTAEVEKRTAKMTADFEMYKNPLVRIMFTFGEILPVGFLVSVISAFILKRK